jgi:hypothetical protein
MKLVDLNGKERKVKSATLITHDVPDIEGNTVKEPFVEVIIKGKQSTWTEWWPFDDFQEMNPEVEI